MNKTFNTIAKSASLFLVGGVLGGVMTYNAFDLQTSYNNSKLEQTAAETTITTTSNETTTEEKDSVKYTPSEAMNTVVSIDVSMTAQANGLLGEILGEQTASASGSGVIYSEDENGIYIITNNHVVEGATSIAIRLDDDDEPAEAKLIGRDPSTDLAVIYVTKDELKEKNIDNYLVSQIGDSDDLEVFDQVYAIGNAAGEGKSGTSGTISALDKVIPAENGEEINAIQIDAAINPGNSGGALINSDGELVGINFAKVVATELEGMGYSIPINDAVEIANQIIEEGSVENPVIIGVESKPFLGVQMFEITPEQGKQYGYNFDTNIVVVQQVVLGSPADKTGIQTGDIIYSFNGVDINGVDQLKEEIAKLDIGDTVKITIVRDNQKITGDITIGNSALFQS